MTKSSFFQKLGPLGTVLCFLYFPIHYIIDVVKKAISHWTSLHSCSVNTANGCQAEDDLIEMGMPEIATTENGMDTEPTMSHFPRSRPKKVVSKRRHGLYKRWGGVPYYVRCAA